VAQASLGVAAGEMNCAHAASAGGSTTRRVGSGSVTIRRKVYGGKLFWGGSPLAEEKEKAIEKDQEAIKPAGSEKPEGDLYVAVTI